MATKPKRIIPFIGPDQLRQLIVDREEQLSRPRDLLLDEAQSCRERGSPHQEFPFPVAAGDDIDAKKANIRASGHIMANFYASETAGDIEALILLLDDLPDLQTRKEAMTRLLKLIRDVRGEAEFGMRSPADGMLKAVEMEQVRAEGRASKEKRHRRELLRPLVSGFSEIFANVSQESVAQFKKTLADHPDSRNSLPKGYPKDPRTLRADIIAVLSL